jgi:SAM-dependent methyltransferase
MWDESKAFTRRRASHPVISDHAARVVGLIKSYILPQQLILELGAGDGYFSVPLSKLSHLLPTDKSSVMLAFNPLKDQGKVLNACKLEYGPNSFDLVFEANMLHHEARSDEVLKEMTRVSKGFIVIVEPNCWNPFNIMVALIRKNERRSLLFSRRYVRNKLKALSLEEVSIMSVGIVPPYSCPEWLWRWVRRVDSKVPFIGLENIFVFRKKNAPEHKE